MDNNKRIENLMYSSSTPCKYFHIRKDNKWYFKVGIYKDIPLDEFDRDILEDMLYEIENNVFTYKTQLNLVQIRREIIYSNRN